MALVFVELDSHRPRFGWTSDRQVTTMTVMDEKKLPSGPVEDHQSQLRWSANKKMAAVLRLLRVEPLEQLSRELEAEAHRLVAWRDECLGHGKQGLKAARADRGDQKEHRLM